MSEEKSRKALKLKTWEEMKNDAVYEINLFSKKRRAPVKIPEEDHLEEQVRNEKIKSNIFLLSNDVQSSVSLGDH